MAVAGFSVYLEFASYFPNRSGSEVVYLEQAYPRPKHLFPVAFAVQSVILSFSSSNAIGEPPNPECHPVLRVRAEDSQCWACGLTLETVLSRYLWRIAEKEPTDWEMKGVAVAAYTLAVIC